MSDQADDRLPAMALFPQTIRSRAGALVWLVLSLVLGIAILITTASSVDINQVWSGLLQADPFWVGLSLFTVLLTTFSKALRWRTLFPPHRRPRLYHLTRALLAGQMANALLPARVGEIVRTYMTVASGDSSGALSLGTIAVEKIFDILLLVICSGLAAILAPLPTPLNLSLLALATAGLLVLVIGVAVPEEHVTHWIDDRLRQRGRLLDWLANILQEGIAGLAALRDLSLATKAFAWSTLIWALAAATNYTLFRAFDLGLPPGAALLVLIVIHIGVAPPSSPGRVGIFHALAMLGLAPFDVTPATSLAYATLLHALVYLPQIVLGALAIGLTKRLSREADR